MRFLYATVTLLFLTGAVGQAGTLNFRYDTGNGIFAGTMTGTLQGDQNTFLVSSLDTLTYKGAAGPSLPFLTSPDHLVFGTGVPKVTLDGTFMDYVSCSNSGCNASFFGFAAGDGFAALVFSGNPFVLASNNLGGNSSFSATHWSASVGGAAPEPGTLTLGLAAAAFATAMSRRKRLARPE